MAGKILVVDPDEPRRAATVAAIRRAFYDTEDAATGQQAVAAAFKHRPDMGITSDDLPDMCWQELHNRLERRRRPGDVPMIVTQTDSETGPERLDMLRAGADEVFPADVSKSLLTARISSLLRQRSKDGDSDYIAPNARGLGFEEPELDFEQRTEISLVCETPELGLGWKKQLENTPSFVAEVITPRVAVERAPAGNRCLILEPCPSNLRLLQRMLSKDATEQPVTIMILGQHKSDIGVKALDLGVGDILANGLDIEELRLRLELLQKRQRKTRAKRRAIRKGLESALRDPLTGLFNRNYALPFLERQAESSRVEGTNFAVMMIDLDHFKSVNDRFGHAVGDFVLRSFGQRIAQNLRSEDMFARIGGEEFLLAMPGADVKAAEQMADRIRVLTTANAFHPPQLSHGIEITVSIGISSVGAKRATLKPQIKNDKEEAVEKMMAQADAALYGAKRDGRNRVKTARPAA